MNGNGWLKSNRVPFPRIHSLLEQLLGLWPLTHSLSRSPRSEHIQEGLHLPFLVPSLFLAFWACVCMWGKYRVSPLLEGRTLPVSTDLPVLEVAATWLLVFVSMKICSGCSFPLVLAFQLGAFKAILNTVRTVNCYLMYLAVFLTVILMDSLRFGIYGVSFKDLYPLCKAG